MTLEGSLEIFAKAPQRRPRSTLSPSRYWASFFDLNEIALNAFASAPRSHYPASPRPHPEPICRASPPMLREPQTSSPSASSLPDLSTRLAVFSGRFRTSTDSKEGNKRKQTGVTRASPSGAVIGSGAAGASCGLPKSVQKCSKKCTKVNKSVVYVCLCVCLGSSEACQSGE